MALPYKFLEDVAPMALGVVDGFPPRKGCPRPRDGPSVPKAVELDDRWVFGGPGQSRRAQRRADASASVL